MPRYVHALKHLEQLSVFRGLAVDSFLSLFHGIPLPEISSARHGANSAGSAPAASHMLINAQELFCDAAYSDRTQRTSFRLEEVIFRLYIKGNFSLRRW